jgi:ubiquinone/menaquinone biosynthesis C-methylase UbiE
LRITGLLTPDQENYIEFAARHEIKWANATRHLPVGNDSCDVVYSSHMVEHLYTYEVPAFLSEAWRVLCPGGILRLAVPDLRRKAESYLRDHDGDSFIQSTMLADFWMTDRLWKSKLRYLLCGAPSCHKWMYDGQSLIARMQSAGFEDCIILPEGETMVADPGSLNLAERSPESVFVEGKKPRRHGVRESVARVEVSRGALC